MEENTVLVQPIEKKFSIPWSLYFIFFTIVFIIFGFLNAIHTKDVVDFIDLFFTVFAVVGLGLFIFNKSSETYGGNFWKIYAIVFPLYDLFKNILIDPFLRHRGLSIIELFFSFLLIMPIYIALFIFSFRDSRFITMVNLCYRRARLSLIYFLLFFVFFTTNIFINMHLDTVRSRALTEERKLTTANYQYLNSLPVDNAHSLSVLEEHPKDFYVYSMKVVDLYHDNSKEFVYKKGGNLYIVDKQWNILYQCFAGVDANGIEKLLVEDINMNGSPEIITTGTKENDTAYSLKIFDNKCNLVSQYPINQASVGISLLFSQENSSSTKILLLKTEYAFPHNFFLLKDDIFNFTEEKVYTDLIKSRETEEMYPLGKEKTVEFKIGANAILVDLNSDGKKEIIVKASDDKYGYPSPTTIFILDSTNGKMLAKYVYQTWINSMEVGDFYGDGKNEIILSGHYNAPFSVLRFQ